MTQPFDPKKSHLALKSREHMIGLAGFEIRLEDGTRHEGLTKIALHRRSYGGGHYTLTFIVDAQGDEALKARMASLFRSLTGEAIRPALGKEFERMVWVSLDGFAEHPGWHITELNFHFRSFEERDAAMIEKRIFPALEQALPLSLEPVEWWPVSRAQGGRKAPAHAESGSLTSVFKKWLGLA